MTWNANSPGYWNTGYDPVKNRYGIPASQHPDYKVLHKAMRDLDKAKQARSEAIVEYLFTDEGKAFAAEHTNPDGDALGIAAAREHAETVLFPPIPGLTPEMEALKRQAYASNLYRRDGLGDLSVRHDRAGKLAWEQELKRLGRK